MMLAALAQPGCRHLFLAQVVAQGRRSLGAQH